MEILLRDMSRDLIFNCDETAWRLFPNGVMTWAPMRTNNVQIQIDGDDNSAIRALATITASGKKVHLFVLGRGKATKCK
jgi:hypothetical protein